jgi:hypothetical protein
MESWHGGGLDAASKAITDHQIVAVTQLVDELHQIGEIITVIGVAHNNEAATCRINTAA